MRQITPILYSLQAIYSRRTSYGIITENLLAWDADGGIRMAQEERVIMGLSVKAMVFFEGRLLLLQKNDAEGLHHWEFPGGGLHFTEDFEAGLRREVQEETGLSVDLEAPVGIWSYQKRDGQFLNGVIFSALAHSGDVVLSDEHLAYRWVSPGEFHTYRIHGSLQRSLRQMKGFAYERSYDLLRDFLAID